MLPSWTCGVANVSWLVLVLLSKQSKFPPKKLTVDIEVRDRVERATQPSFTSRHQSDHPPPAAAARELC